MSPPRGDMFHPLWVEEIDMFMIMVLNLRLDGSFSSASRSSSTTSLMMRSGLTSYSLLLLLLLLLLQRSERSGRRRARRAASRPCSTLQGSESLAEMRNMCQRHAEKGGRGRTRARFFPRASSRKRSAASKWVRQLAIGSEVASKCGSGRSRRW